MELGDDIKILKDLVIRLLKRVEELEFENAALRADVADLRSKLNQNSKNSHKPPSSDGLSKKPALPKEPAKKSGGQFLPPLASVQASPMGAKCRCRASSPTTHGEAECKARVLTAVLPPSASAQAPPMGQSAVVVRPRRQHTARRNAKQGCLPLVSFLRLLGRMPSAEKTTISCRRWRIPAASKRQGEIPN